MTNLSRNCAAFLSLLMLSGALSSPASACGFDGILDGNFSALHPRSMTVAFAIREAVDLGFVDRSAVDPVVPGSAGYWRAVSHLDEFAGRLSSAPSQNGKATTISILLIDSNLWARLTPSSKGYDVRAHTNGAHDEGVVIITNESILNSILNGRLSIEVALEHSLLMIDGTADDANYVQAIALESFKSRSADAIAKGGWDRKAQFFGRTK